MKTVIRILSLIICLVLLSSCTAGKDTALSSSAAVSGDQASHAASYDSESAAGESSADDASSAALSDAESLASSDNASSEYVSSADSQPTSSQAASSAKPTSSQAASSAKPTSSQAASSSKPSASINPDPNDGKIRYEGTRDPFYWPFAEDSIWNMPIGSGAKLQKANFGDAYSIGIDDEYIIKVPEGSPTVEVKSPSAWNKRWPGNMHQGYMQVPSNFYLADCVGNNTPNNCAAFIMPDGRTIKQLEPTCRLGTGSTHIVGWLHEKELDIYGAGIEGTHYGSGLSAIGGSIRKGELTGDEPIRHAIKLNVWANKYCYYDKSTSKGYVWPADRHDSYAESGNMAYGGTNPNLRMGTLLTIPKNITAQSLGIKSEVGKKIFYALQNYGCYIVDDSAWDNYSFSMEEGVRAEVSAKYQGIDVVCARNYANDYYYDALKMIENLYIVTNNSPSSIGGGGTPCQPLAPLFKE